MTFHQLKKHKIRGEPTKIPSHDFCACRIPPLLMLILSKKSPYLSDPHGIQNSPISNPRHFCGSWAKGLGHVRASSNCKQFRARPAKVQVVRWKYGEPTGKKGPYFSMKWLFNSFCCNPWYTLKQPRVFFNCSCQKLHWNLQISMYLSGTIWGDFPFMDMMISPRSNLLWMQTECLVQCLVQGQRDPPSKTRIRSKFCMIFLILWISMKNACLYTEFKRFEVSPTNSQNLLMCFMYNNFTLGSFSLVNA